MNQIETPYQHIVIRDDGHPVVASAGMTIRFLTDQNVSKVIVNGLRLREVDVITAYEDGSSTIVFIPL